MDLFSTIGGPRSDLSVLTRVTRVMPLLAFGRSCSKALLPWLKSAPRASSSPAGATVGSEGTRVSGAQEGTPISSELLLHNKPCSSIDSVAMQTHTPCTIMPQNRWTSLRYLDWESEDVSDKRDTEPQLCGCGIGCSFYFRRRC